MFSRLLSRLIAAVLPQQDYILPRWAPIERKIAPLREIIITDGEYFQRLIIYSSFADV